MIKNNAPKPYFIESVFMQAKDYAAEIIKVNPGVSPEKLRDLTNEHLLSIKKRGRYKEIIFRQTTKAINELLALN
jgi:hypothetical protein